MAKLQEKILDHKDLRLVSVSVDPKNDRPEVLAEYARRYGGRPDKWTLLTGDSATLHNVVIGGYMAPFHVDEQNPELITHSPLFILVDKELRIRGFYRVIDSQDGQKEFKRLLEEIDVLRCQYRNP
jgi:protein SCO1/2